MLPPPRCVDVVWLQPARHARRFGIVSLLVLGPLLTGSLVLARTGAVDDKAELEGPNVERAVDAARRLGERSGSAAAALLVSRLKVGAAPRLEVAILKALRKQQTDAISAILRKYAGNRNVDVRIAALTGLGPLRGHWSSAILLDALGDSQPRVRSLAARLLAERGERAAERRLLALLRRGDQAAVVPLGQVASAKTAQQLTALVDELPPAAVAGAFAEMLKRPTFGPDPLRVEIVKTLGKLPGPDATAALVEYVASVPEAEKRASKKLAEEILARGEQ